MLNGFDSISRRRYKWLKKKREFHPTKYIGIYEGKSLNATMSHCFKEPRYATLAHLIRKIASDLGRADKIHKHIFKCHDCTWKTEKCAIISSFKDFYSLAKRLRCCSENGDFFDSTLHLHSKKQRHISRLKKAALLNYITLDICCPTILWF